MPKTKSENKAVEIEMDDIAIQTNIIQTGIKLKSLSTKKEYGTNQRFQILGEMQYEDIFKLAEHIKMPVWKYNDKCYMRNNESKC